MSRDTIKTIKLIFNLAQDKKTFFAWLLLRFISALFPIATVYFYSQVIKSIETKAGFSSVLSMVLMVFGCRIFHNFTRLLSTNKLNHVIGNIKLDIENVLVSSVNTQDKKSRNKAIQAIRNFSDASATTLDIFKQPGIDAVVSFISIPAILFFLDFKVFILQIAYMATYYFTDIYTTGKYTKLKNKHNSRVESYYAKLQIIKDFKYEQTVMKKTYKKVCDWGIIEWLLLQNIAVTFYSLSLLYLAYSTYVGQKTIADLVLVIGYISSTQSFLNNISDIKDAMTDTKVALHRLLDNKKTLAVDYDDLTT